MRRSRKRDFGRLRGDAKRYTIPTRTVVFGPATIRNTLFGFRKTLNSNPPRLLIASGQMARVLLMVSASRTGAMIYAGNYRFGKKNLLDFASWRDAVPVLVWRKAIRRGYVRVFPDQGRGIGLPTIPIVRSANGPGLRLCF